MIRFAVAALIAAALLVAAWNAAATRAAVRAPLPPSPARVVSLSPSTTECAFALGLGGRLAGVTASCDYPPEARLLPKVGGPAPDLERVIALRPDLVIGDDSLSGRHLDRLQSIGVPVWSASGRTVEGVFADLESLARAMGDAGRGRALAASLRARLARVRESLGVLPAGRRPRVLFEYWPDPLWTAGRGTYIDELVTLAGGRNAAAPLREGWGPVPWESVLTEDPDVIAIAHAFPAGCARRPGWAALRAVREGRLPAIDRDLFLRTGPRGVDAVETLARALHPGKF